MSNAASSETFDAEVKALREKLAAADSRERILSQHLLDNQTELAEIQLKHDKEMATISAKLDANGTSAKKLDMLSDLVSYTAVAVGSAASKDTDLQRFKQQVAEAMAANKTFIGELPLEEKVCLHHLP